MLNEIVRMVADHELTERTRFVGQVRPEKVPFYLATSDAFVSASLSEVHPLTVIEALLAGLPVLAIDAPGVNDIVVSGVSGLLASGSKSSLAKAMGIVACNDDLHGRLARGAKTAGERYDIKNTVERTLSLYWRLLEQRDRQDCMDEIKEYIRTRGGSPERQRESIHD